MEPLIITNKTELLQHISQTIGKTKVLQLTDILYTRKFEVNDLVELTFYPQKEVAFRAAWILENLILTNPRRFVNSLDVVTASVLIIQNKSCLRHYVKVMMHVTGPKADLLIRQKISEIDMEPVTARCFDLIIDPKTPVAITAFAIQVLFHLQKRYSWIAEMLTDQIKIMLKHNSKPAIQSRGRKLLHYLEPK